MNALELDAPTVEAFGLMYSTAAAAFSSMDVEWWVTVGPSEYGPEIGLRMAWGVRDRRRVARMTITQALIHNSGPALRRDIENRVRECRERLRQGELD